MAKTTTYSLDDRTLESIEALSEVLTLSKTEVLRRAVAGFGSLVVYGYRESERTIRELNERYNPDEHLAVFLHQNADGQAEPSIRIGAEVPDDVVVFAIFPPPGDHALMYVETRNAGDDPDAAERDSLALKLALGRTHGRRPRLVHRKAVMAPEAGRSDPAPHRRAIAGAACGYAGATRTRRGMRWTLRS